MTRLAGKSALITGAARGIGYHFAKTFAAEGARVALGDIDIDRARTAAGEIGDAAIAIEMDVTRQASIDAAVAKTDASFGGIDILVNNAAVFHRRADRRNFARRLPECVRHQCCRHAVHHAGGRQAR